MLLIKQDLQSGYYNILNRNDDIPAGIDTMP